jgi:hypothetical protein
VIIVTDKAKEKLKQKKDKVTSDPEVVFRVIRSPKKPEKLELVLHKQEEADKVIKDDGGTKVLLVEPGLAPALEGKVIDYLEMPERGFEGFWISETSS